MNQIYIIDVPNVILNNNQIFLYEKDGVYLPMSEKEMQVSEIDLQGVKLKETTTKAQESEMKLLFKCPDGSALDWPVCCGEVMELEGDKLNCVVEGCGKSVDVPTCTDGSKAKPFIGKA